MSKPETGSRNSWVNKFRCAFRGAKLGVRGQSSFSVHFFVAAVVIAAALALGATIVDWCLLLGCITIVLSVEMVNSALEQLAKAVDDRPNIHIRDALDIGSGAVLVASIGAMVIGAVVFLNLLAQNLNW
ncbi:MAG TPA: diacylglycerol kinase [Pirellulales bacterium]|jgi:diacylglycerol kinase